MVVTRRNSEDSDTNQMQKVSTSAPDPQAGRTFSPGDRFLRLLPIRMMSQRHPGKYLLIIAAGLHIHMLIMPIEGEMEHQAQQRALAESRTRAIRNLWNPLMQSNTANATNAGAVRHNAK